jgi:hypothetical protein
MSLTAIPRTQGYKKELLLYAFHHRPSLIIDCANCANPHALFHDIEQEWLSDVFIIEVEIIYKFRDVLLYTHDFAKANHLKSIVITPFDHLFHYDNSRENKIVLNQCFNIINHLSKSYEVVIPLNGTHRTKPKTSPRPFARRA